jgi:hypothetical protein
MQRASTEDGKVGSGDGKVGTGDGKVSTGDAGDAGDAGRIAQQAADNGMRSDGGRQNRIHGRRSPAGPESSGSKGATNGGGGKSQSGGTELQSGGDDLDGLSEGGGMKCVRDRKEGGGKHSDRARKGEATLWLYHDNPHWHMVCSKALAGAKGVAKGMEVLLETKSSKKMVLLMLGRVYASYDLFIEPSNDSTAADQEARDALQAVGGAVGNERGGYLLKMDTLVGFGDVQQLPRRQREERQEQFIDISMDQTGEFALALVAPQQAEAQQAESQREELTVASFLAHCAGGYKVILAPQHDGLWYPYEDALTKRTLPPAGRSAGVGYLALGDDTKTNGGAFLSADEGHSFLRPRSETEQQQHKDDVMRRVELQRQASGDSVGSSVGSPRNSGLEDAPPFAFEPMLQHLSYQGFKEQIRSSKWQERKAAVLLLEHELLFPQHPPPSTPSGEPGALLSLCDVPGLQELVHALRDTCSDPNQLVCAAAISAFAELASRVAERGRGVASPTKGASLGRESFRAEARGALPLLLAKLRLRSKMVLSTVRRSLASLVTISRALTLQECVAELSAAVLLRYNGPATKQQGDSTSPSASSASSSGAKGSSKLLPPAGRAQALEWLVECLHYGRPIVQQKAKKTIASADSTAGQVPVPVSGNTLADLSEVCALGLEDADPMVRGAAQSALQVLLLTAAMGSLNSGSSPTSSPSNATTDTRMSPAPPMPPPPSSPSSSTPLSSTNPTTPAPTRRSGTGSSSKSSSSKSSSGRKKESALVVVGAALRQISLRLSARASAKVQQAVEAASELHASSSGRSITLEITTSTPVPKMASIDEAADKNGLGMGNDDEDGVLQGSVRENGAAAGEKPWAKKGGEKPWAKKGKGGVKDGPSLKETMAERRRQAKEKQAGSADGACIAEAPSAEEEKEKEAKEKLRKRRQQAREKKKEEKKLEEEAAKAAAGSGLVLGAGSDRLRQQWAEIEFLLRSVIA